jgi:hypothetical protein
MPTELPSWRDALAKLRSCGFVWSVDVLMIYDEMVYFIIKVVDFSWKNECRVSTG